MSRYNDTHATYVEKRGFDMGVKGINAAWAAGCVAMVLAAGTVAVVTTIYQVGNMQAQAAFEVFDVSARAVSAYERALAMYKANWEKAQNEDKAPAIVVPNGVAAESVADQMGVDASLVQKDADGAYVYIIQEGDTLSELSAVFGYSVDEIANFNQVRNVNLIYDGSALRIPNS